MFFVNGIGMIGSDLHPPYLELSNTPSISLPFNLIIYLVWFMSIRYKLAAEASIKNLQGELIVYWKLLNAAFHVSKV